MNNPFFKNFGPFKIDDILESLNYSNKDDYKGEAFVEGKRMADAQWSATIVDKK